MFHLTGCFGDKYDLILDNGLEAPKKRYTAGASVEITYEFIATDTDYRFYSNDVDMKQSYEEGKGYVLRFKMPAHDVKVEVYHKNSMMYDPDAAVPKTEEQLLEIAAGSRLVFEYYDGVVGTDGYDGHDDYCLYRQSDGGMIMTKTSVWQGKTEEHACTVIDDILFEALAEADRYDMRHWTKGDPIDGHAYMVKFAEADRMITVNSNLIPEGGLKGFGAVQMVMEKAWRTYGP